MCDLETNARRIWETAKARAVEPPNGEYDPAAEFDEGDVERPDSDEIRPWGEWR